ncbi:MAG: penicillin-binding transpeptidase domain-containing protein [Planctomycetia bacterium]
MGFRRRLLLLTLLAAAASLAVWLRVAWLQVLTADHWEQAARRARLSETVQQPRRGSIVDASGRSLVEDQPVMELVLVPSEWRQRQRFRCEACGSLHYREAGQPAPARPRCCARPGPLAALGEGDPAALEQALGLARGAIAVRAARRLAEVDRQVEAYTAWLAQEEGLDEDDFLVRDRIAAFRGNRESQPVVLAPDVGELPARLVALDEVGALRGLRLRPAHVRVSAVAGPLARVIGQAALPSREDLERARARAEELELDVPVGSSGLEQRYDAVLRGRPGRELRTRGDDLAAQEVLESEAAEPGSTLRLSASLEACAAAQRALESLPGLLTGYAPRTQPSGALVAMRADTGEIVALAELPAWQRPRDRVGYLPPGSAPEVLALPDREVGDWVPAHRVHGVALPEAEQQQQVARSSGFERVLLPWRLRRSRLEPLEAVPAGFDRERWRGSLALPAGEWLSRISQVAVEPGSTLKAFIGLAMLESGLPLPIQEEFACEGRQGEPGCHNHPLVGFEEALEHSCNQYFAFSLRDFATHWPTFRTSVAGFMDRMGFGQPTGSDLQGEARGRWLRSRRWEPGEVPEIPRDSGRMVAIGQGEVTATPLQMVRAVAALANGGRLVTPHLVQQVLAPGAQPRVPQPPVLDLGLHPEHVARVREGMRRVVYGDYGTARHSYPWGTIPARIFAKTGTAQVPVSWRPFHPGTTSRDVSHHWLVGFAEAPGQPPLAFALVYHARLEPAAGVTAARSAGEFLRWWFTR